MSIYKELKEKKKAISVTGLGYVGLPLALEFARHFKVIGFDIKEDRVAMMRDHIDPSKELDSSAFDGTDIEFTSDPEDLKKAHFHIIGVPTDIDEHKVPNLKPLLGASHSIGRALKPVSNGNQEPGDGFKLGYSPERIVPGSKSHTLTNILKIISGNDAYSRAEIGKVYSEILTGGIHEAASIKVAEAAKVIENTQRDINISLMNELAIIFDKLNIDTNAVIEAAGTKWNFHKYQPGLVGGHCISVDPFYLMHKAKQLGHDPQVIAAGRRVNDYIPRFIAKRIVQTLIEIGKNPGHCKVLVMGVTFKEDVADIRNSKVADLINELSDFSLQVDVVDPWASKAEVAHEYDITMIDEPKGKYDAVVVAVPHKEYKSLDRSFFENILQEPRLVFDLKGMYDSTAFDGFGKYWKL